MGAPKVLLCSDLDHTMVQNEDLTHKRLLAFGHAWEVHLAGQQRGILTFSTGRSPTLFRKLWSEAPLLTPDVLICSVGTEVFYNKASPAGVLAGQSHHQTIRLGRTSGALEFVPDPEWEAYLSVGWDRSHILDLVTRTAPQMTLQADTEQRPHKISYNLEAGSTAEAEKIVERVATALKAEGLPAKVIFSGGRDVDVISERAGKGRALAFLLDRLRAAGLGPEKVVVSGDSGNDKELFLVPGVLGCVVSNAHPELRAFAESYREFREQANGDATRPRIFEGNQRWFLGFAPDAATYGILYFLGDLNCCTHSPHVYLQAAEPCAGAILQSFVHYGVLPPHAVPSSILGDVAGDTAGSQLGSGVTQQTAAAAKASGTGTASSQGVEGKELLREAVAAEPAVAPETTAAETLPAGIGAQTAQQAHLGASPSPAQVSPVPSVGEVQAQLQAQRLEAKEAGLINGPGTEEVRVREFAYRLGTALAESLAHLGGSTSSAPAVQPHSAADLSNYRPLALTLSNACVIRLRTAGKEGLGVESIAQRNPDTGKATVATATTINTTATSDRREVAAGEAFNTLSGIAALAGASLRDATMSAATTIGNSVRAAVESVTQKSEGDLGASESSKSLHEKDPHPEPDQEVAEELKPTPVSEAARHAAGSTVGRSWVDGLRSSSEGNGAWKLSFNVAWLNDSGDRSPVSYSVVAVATSQTEPVPHGFLAEDLVVSGPLPENYTIPHVVNETVTA